MIEKKKLFIIDDHKIVRDGLKAMMLGRVDVQVIGEAGSAAQALQELSQLTPDLVFVDLKLPDASGAELIAKIKTLHPDSRCALLTADPNTVALKQAQQGGALALLTKDMQSSEYMLALDKMLEGKKYASAAFAELLMDEGLHYTPRELEVLKGFSDGLSYKEIGAKLEMSPRTVETHKTRLMEKMGVKSIVEMVRRAIRDGLIDP
ncbi:MAG: response regulator transcription factor [Reichenbachiella sp.]|uniref:response regulator transcription factor n=1 Tax=Reichenbachiella sp. TaxID=2184521 RepID=UPI0029675D53|nr:response regulator transcription factor [Reichenbachiella sp.]MDW3209060.1 response regulator transcription factor [Reichenbachiella sp.]